MIRCKKNIKEIILLIFIGTVLFSVYYNIKCINNSDFMKTSFTSCLTLIIAIVVSYYFVKRNQDERNQKEIYLHLIEETKKIIKDGDLVRIKDDTDINLILMKKRDLNNCVALLNRYAHKFEVEKEMVFVKDKLKEYAEIIGNHQGDVEYLTKSEIELRRPIELIDNKLEEIMMKLFD